MTTRPGRFAVGTVDEENTTDKKSNPAQKFHDDAHFETVILDAYNLQQPGLLQEHSWFISRRILASL
jgi:hypothetical protein